MIGESVDCRVAKEFPRRYGGRSGRGGNRPKCDAGNQMAGGTGSTCTPVKSMSAFKLALCPPVDFVAIKFATVIDSPARTPVSATVVEPLVVKSKFVSVPAAASKVAKFPVSAIVVGSATVLPPMVAVIVTLLRCCSKAAI